MTTTGKTYQTSDLYLAAFLRARGMFIADVEREGRRSIFCFRDTPDRGELVREFFNDGFVNAYKNALVDLKSMIYAT